MKKHRLTHRPPSAITLIELLVVVAILSLLSVFVLPAINGNRENTANRNAAQQVSSLISQARNDAIAVGRPGGITVLANELDIARCRVPPPYRGALATSRLRFSSGPPTLTQNTLGDIANILTAGVQGGDYITFDGYAGRYQIRPVPPATTPAITTTSFQIVLAGSAATTPWPPESTVGIPVPLAFAIERQPRIVGTPISLANESSIDMTWSGYGGLGGYESFGAGNQVSVVFDETGVLNELVVGGSRTFPDGAVFLLVGRVDRRGGNYNAAAGPAAGDDTIGTNWQYPTSYWIGIDPASGQVRIAECAPIELPGDGLDNDGDGVVDELIEIPNDGIDNDGDSDIDELQEVVSSQRWVRAALVTPGL